MASARIWVVGNSGSGKTTLARKVAARLGVPHVELDSINHQPGWQSLDPEEFRRTVAERCSGPSWVVCGNYAGVVGELLWTLADTVVWIDLPRRTVMRQIVGRTLRRVLTREELWNGNREPWSNLWSWDPERNVIR